MSQLSSRLSTRSDSVLWATRNFPVLDKDANSDGRSFQTSAQQAIPNAPVEMEPSQYNSYREGALYNAPNYLFILSYPPKHFPSQISS
jgi:hypothetical protein